MPVSLDIWKTINEKAVLDHKLQISSICDIISPSSILYRHYLSRHSQNKALEYTQYSAPNSTIFWEKKWYIRWKNKINIVNS